jgi:hypothetical protein
MRLVFACVLVVALGATVPVLAQDQALGGPAGAGAASSKTSPLPRWPDGSMVRWLDDSRVQAASVRRPPAKKPKRGLRVYGIVENEHMAATKSFTATLGTSSLLFEGGGGDLLNLWKGVFARVSFANTSKTGSRASVSGGQAFSQNIALTVSMTPIEVGGGWRFKALDTKDRVVPYLGVAALMLRYKETSQFAEPGDDINTTVKGSVFFAGVEFGLTKFVQVAVEGQFRNLPTALGVEGVSKDFGESDLGGGVLRFQFGVRF